MNQPVSVRTLRPADIADCSRILYSLPNWFGMEESNRAYMLIDWAEDWCRERSIPWLHVKTRGPSTPDPGYDRTRRFYLAQGYAPLFESLALWGPENAALVLVKHIACGTPGQH